MTDYDHVPTEALNEQISQIENVIGQSSETPPAKAVPEKSAAVHDALMRETMSKAYDTAQARGEQEAARMTVPTVPAKNIDRHSKTPTTGCRRAKLSEPKCPPRTARSRQIKANAAKFGVTLDDTEALKLAYQIEAQGGNAQGGIPAE